MRHLGLPEFLVRATGGLDELFVLREEIVRHRRIGTATRYLELLEEEFMPANVIVEITLQRVDQALSVKKILYGNLLSHCFTLFSCALEGLAEHWAIALVECFQEILFAIEQVA